MNTLVINKLNMYELVIKKLKNEVIKKLNITNYIY